MTQESPLQKINALSPAGIAPDDTASAAIKRLSKEETDSDLSFLSLLESLPDESAPIRLIGSITESVRTQPSKPEDESDDAKKTTVKEASVTAQETQARSAQSKDAIKDKPEKDLKDFDDMWTMSLQQLSASDLKILQNLAQVPPMTLQALNNLSPSILEQFPQTYYKSLNVSADLNNMLEKAYKTQRPLRIDLSETASIILRLSKDGRVSAEFLPGDQAADWFFRQNLQQLRSILESKKLPYGELTVRDWRQGKDQSQQDRNPS